MEENYRSLLTGFIILKNHLMTYEGQSLLSFRNSTSGSTLKTVIAPYRPPPCFIYSTYQGLTLHLLILSSGDCLSLSPPLECQLQKGRALSCHCHTLRTESGLPHRRPQHLLSEGMNESSKETSIFPHPQKVTVYKIYNSVIYNYKNWNLYAQRIAKQIRL